MDRIFMFLCRLNHMKGMSYIHQLLLNILKVKTVGILMECWWSSITKSRDVVFSRDLARFHRCEVLHLFYLKFWAFWQKNGANRTNIKEDRAILRFFKMAAIFRPSCIRFHTSEVLCLFLLRFRAFWRKNEANRTNIKEDRAFLRFFKMAAIFRPSLNGTLPKSNQFIYSY
jgi:hypothetical protein